MLPYTRHLAGKRYRVERSKKRYFPSQEELNEKERLKLVKENEKQILLLKLMVGINTVPEYAEVGY